MHEIGRAFGKDHGSIQFLLLQCGGIVPPARQRSLRTLTLAEREDISRGIASGFSIREIARGLQRAAATPVFIRQSREFFLPLKGKNEFDGARRTKVIFHFVRYPLSAFLHPISHRGDL